MNEAIVYFSLFLSVFAFIMGATALILNVATRLSTHRIEFKPLTTELFKEEDESQGMDESDDKLLEKAMGLSRKKKKIEDPLDEVLATSNF
jgi:hypothetical protein